MIRYDRKEVSDFVDMLVDNMMDYACRNFNVCEADWPVVKVCFDKRVRNSYFRTVCRNGSFWNVIQIAVYEAKINHFYDEYVHIMNDNDIGNFQCVRENEEGDLVPNWKKYISALVSHEMAHFIVCNSNSFINPPKNQIYHSVDKIHIYQDGTRGFVQEDQKEHHGDDWQYVYRCLRNEFVNSGKYNELETLA